MVRSALGKSYWAKRSRNEGMAMATRISTGMFYGQCSELCGRNHAFMPIAVRVVTDEEFATWLDSHKKSAARDDAGKVATAEK